LYYGVLIERDPFHFTYMEGALIVFFIAFAVDEISSLRDAGTAFYTADFWSIWDLCIILIAVGFLVVSMYYRAKEILSLRSPIPAGIIGLVKDSDAIVDIAFDILSLEALLLIPR
jgi:hypothetical protein